MATVRTVCQQRNLLRRWIYKIMPKNLECPRCNRSANTRRVATEPGYNPDLDHCVCDLCKIGWYQMPHAGKVRLSVNKESARLAYVAPVK